MNWLSKQASDTQITHGQRIWLYFLAAVIMFLLVFLMNSQDSQCQHTGIFSLIFLLIQLKHFLQ